MDQSQVEQILRNPKFQKMVKKKSALSWTLTIIMLVLYATCWLQQRIFNEFI